MWFSLLDESRVESFDLFTLFIDVSNQQVVRVLDPIPEVFDADVGGEIQVKFGERVDEWMPERTFAFTFLGKEEERDL